MRAGLRFAGHAARQRSRAVAELDAVHAVRGAVQAGAADGHARRPEHIAGTDEHPVGRGVLVEYVQRLADGRDAEPAPLADGEAAK